MAAESGLRSLNFHSGLLLLEEQIMLKRRAALLRDKVLLALCLANDSSPHVHIHRRVVSRHHAELPMCVLPAGGAGPVGGVAAAGTAVQGAGGERRAGGAHGKVRASEPLVVDYLVYM